MLKTNHSSCVFTYPYGNSLIDIAALSKFVKLFFMNELTRPSWNRTILPLFVVSLLLVGAYFFDRKKIRSLSNPRKGGWSKKKISAYNKRTGSHLKHGVTRDPKTLEDFKRKGSWAIRHFKRRNTSSGLNMAPLKNEKGELLPFSTQALAWGEKPPKSRKEQKRLVNLGEKLLKTYQKYKKLGYKNRSELPKEVQKKFKKSLK